MLGLRMRVKYKPHKLMCLNNAHTNKFILYTVTFENRVNCSVIAIEIKAQKGVLKV